MYIYNHMLIVEYSTQDNTALDIISAMHPTLREIVSKLY